MDASPEEQGAEDLELGLTATCAIVTLLLVSTLIWQLSTQRFHTGSYWLSLVLCATVGTLFADTLAGDFGINLWVLTVGTNITSAGLVVLFLLVVGLSATTRHRRSSAQSGAGQVTDLWSGHDRARPAPSSG